MDTHEWHNLTHAFLQEARVAEKAKARADQTVLAREVKRLRGELETAKVGRVLNTHTRTYICTDVVDLSKHRPVNSCLN